MSLLKWFKGKDSPKQVRPEGRRAYVRIEFPRGEGHHELPRVKIKSAPIDLYNISMGGCAALPHPPESIPTPNVGEKLELLFFWDSPTAEIQQMAIFRGLRQGVWGLQFEKADPNLLARITKLLEPGIDGSKMVLISPSIYKEGDGLLEWYRSPMGSEIVLKGKSVETLEQVDFHLGERGLIWSEAKGFHSTSMKSKKGFNPNSEMREFSEDPYFVYVDDALDLHLVKQVLLLIENIPTSGPALKFIRNKLIDQLK